MGRQAIGEHPGFVYLKSRLELSDGKIAEAKAQAYALVEAAKKVVKNERLAAIREAIEVYDLSAYGVGLATGVTRGDLKNALIAEAMGSEWSAKNPKAAPSVVFEGVGTESGLSYRAVLLSFEAPVNAWGKLEVSSRWSVQHDVWGTFVFVQAGVLGWSCVPELAEDAIRGGDMPDDVFNGMKLWKPEAS